MGNSVLRTVYPQCKHCFNAQRLNIKISVLIYLNRCHLNHSSLTTEESFEKGAHSWAWAELCSMLAYEAGFLSKPCWDGFWTNTHEIVPTRALGVSSVVGVFEATRDAGWCWLLLAGREGPVDTWPSVVWGRSACWWKRSLLRTCWSIHHMSYLLLAFPASREAAVVVFLSRVCSLSQHSGDLAPSQKWSSWLSPSFAFSFHSPKVT